MCANCVQCEQSVSTFDWANLAYIEAPKNGVLFNYYAKRLTHTPRQVKLKGACLR